MSQMANIFYFFWVIQESHMEKLIPNSDSTSKKSVEKRQVWVKESFGKKKLRVGQEDKNDKRFSLWSESEGSCHCGVFCYMELVTFQKMFSKFQKMFYDLYCFCQIFSFCKRYYWKISTRWPKKTKKKPLKNRKHSLK